jgi:hypothetical protein
MSRGTYLNETEKNIILNLKKEGTNLSKISRVIKRSRNVIRNFLNNSKNYGKKTSKGRPRAENDRDIRKKYHILHQILL